MQKERGRNVEGVAACPHSEECGYFGRRSQKSGLNLTKRLC
jgi:hypothetical protein